MRAEAGVSRETEGASAEPPPPLQARSLTLRRGSRSLLKEISLSLPAHKLTVLLGPNGSGKTTLLRCLAGSLTPEQGEVLLEGKPLATFPAASLAQKAAYVPQDNPMPFAFTIRELVRLAASARDRGEYREEEALQLLDLEELAERSVVTLSGGERQRAALARAIAQNIPLLLLDEPTAHLDLRYQFNLLQHLRQRARAGQGTALVVLHDLNLAAEWADWLFLLHQGTLVAEGTPESVLTEVRLRRIYQAPLVVEKRPETGKLQISFNSLAEQE